MDILPASGGAIELLQTPDEERRFEETIVSSDDNVVEAFAESVKPNFIYKNLPIVARSEKHLFRYFIDGSVQTYVLGTGMENDRNFPIVMAQIGAAALHRKDNGMMEKSLYIEKVLLLLPFSSLSTTAVAKIQQTAQSSTSGGIEVVDTSGNDENLGEANVTEDITNRATGIAKSRMRAIERELAMQLGQQTQDCFVIDGTIRSGSFGWGQSVPKNAVAISKSFTHKPKFDVFGRGEQEIKNLPRLLAGLEAECRTPAFFTSGGKVIFWYLRMRAQGEVDYPLMGVIKVEVPAKVAGEKIDVDYIDTISSCLLAERTVSPHGLDSRWHAHIYPVFLTEKFLKTSFYSREVFKGLIKWPKLKEIYAAR